MQPNCWTKSCLSASPTCTVIGRFFTVLKKNPDYILVCSSVCPNKKTENKLADDEFSKEERGRETPEVLSDGCGVLYHLSALAPRPPIGIQSCVFSAHLGLPRILPLRCICQNVCRCLTPSSSKLQNHRVSFACLGPHVFLGCRNSKQQTSDVNTRCLWCLILWPLDWLYCWIFCVFLVQAMLTLIMKQFNRALLYLRVAFATEIFLHKYLFKICLELSYFFYFCRISLLNQWYFQMQKKEDMWNMLWKCNVF